MDAQQVIAESRPMLEEFFAAIGIYQLGQPLKMSAMLEPFANWLSVQRIDQADRFYLAARVGAFICEHLIETRSAQRVIEGNRILLRTPIEHGAVREFDPYALAIGAIDDPSSLRRFLNT